MFNFQSKDDAPLPVVRAICASISAAALVANESLHKNIVGIAESAGKPIKDYIAEIAVEQADAILRRIY